MTHPTDDHRAGPADLPRVARLSDLGDFEVAEGHPDVRGWDVRAADGTLVGRVKDLIVDTGAMRTRYLDVELIKELRSVRTGEGRVLVPASAVQLQDKGHHVLLPGVSAQQLAAFPTYDEYLLEKNAPRFAQDDFDNRRFYTTGERAGTAPRVGNADTRADEIRIPLHGEEDVVIEKRPVVREELVIRRRTAADTTPADADVRREQVDVNRPSAGEPRRDVRDDRRAP